MSKSNYDKSSQEKSASTMYGISESTLTNGKQDEIWETLKAHLFSDINLQANRGDKEILFLPKHKVFSFYDWDQSPALVKRVIDELRSLGYVAVFHRRIGLYVNWEKQA